MTIDGIAAFGTSAVQSTARPSASTEGSTAVAGSGPDFGQMLMMHVFLFPGVIALLVIAHVIYVRLHGVVPPIEADLVEARLAEAKLADEPADTVDAQVAIAFQPEPTDGSAE